MIDELGLFRIVWLNEYKKLIGSVYLIEEYVICFKEF
jgi:hypothetical protein